MIDYKKELNTLRTCIYELQERHDKLLLEYRKSCTHPNVKHDKKYYAGGYDYSAHSVHTYTCTDCYISWCEEENHNSGFE